MGELRIEAWFESKGRHGCGGYACEGSIPSSPLGSNPLSKRGNDMRLKRRKNESIFTLTSDDMFKAMVLYIRSKYRVSGKGGVITSIDAVTEDNEDEISSIVVHTDMPGKYVKRMGKRLAKEEIT